MDVHYSGAETPFVLIPLPGKRTVRMLYLDDLPTDIGAGPFPVQKDKVDAEEWENYERALAYHRSGPSLEQLPGYNLNIDTVEDEPINVEYIKACAVSCDGGLLVAVGKCGVQILLR